MALGFPTRRVREGLVELLVPDVPQGPGPGTRSALPFYNPAMAVARDVSVVVAGRLLPRGGTVLDGLAATGVLGLRIARESGREPAVTLNDKNPKAVVLIRANLALNPGLEADVEGGDLNAHLATRRHDLVEIDPFGSPVPFLDAALRSARRGSLLGVTATDTAVLCGAKPEAARRRYLADVRHTDAYAEVGTRLLLGYVVRMAARFDKGVEPVLAYAAEHFVNVHVRVAEGAARADRALAHLGRVAYDPATGEHRPLGADAPGPAIGPLWMGPLGDADLVAGLVPSAAMGYPAARLLDFLRGEIALPPFYVDNNAMARRAGVPPPPPSDVIARLRDRGFRAAPTHFRRNAVKTDAPWADLAGAYGGAGP